MISCMSKVRELKRNCCSMNCRFATMEGVLALVRLYQRFTFTVNDQKHGGKPLEYESLITLMPKVQRNSAALMHAGGSWFSTPRMNAAADPPVLEQGLSTQHRSRCFGIEQCCCLRC